MSFQELIDDACKEDTLIKAMAYVAIWESERVLDEAVKVMRGEKPRDADGQGWSTCFEFLFKEVMEQYTVKRLKGL